MEDDSISVVADALRHNAKILSTAVYQMSSFSLANIPRITFSECAKYAFRCSTFMEMFLTTLDGN